MQARAFPTLPERLVPGLYHGRLIPRSRVAVSLMLALALALALSGCTSQPVSNEPMALARASVQRADTSNTRVAAPAQLQTAVAKLASAEQAAAREDYELSAQLAEQADLDAQVATLHAQRVRSERSAQESLDAAAALRDESRRQTQ
jgi:hypothetical protein